MLAWPGFGLLARAKQPAIWHVVVAAGASLLAALRGAINGYASRAPERAPELVSVAEGPPVYPSGARAAD